MSREDIDKLFQEAYQLETQGQKNNAYRLYSDAIARVKQFRKLAPVEDHESIDSLIREVSVHADELFKEISEGISSGSSSSPSSTSSSSYNSIQTNSLASGYHSAESNDAASSTASSSYRPSSTASSGYKSSNPSSNFKQSYSSYSSPYPSPSSANASSSTALLSSSSGNEAFSMSAPPSSSTPHPIDVHGSVAPTPLKALQTNIQNINEKYKITETINKGAKTAKDEIVDFGNRHQIPEKLSISWEFIKNVSVLAGTALCTGTNKVIKKFRGIDDSGEDSMSFQRDEHVGGY